MNSTEIRTESRRGGVYERVAQEQLATRLGQVQSLLAGGLGPNLPRIRELLAAAADQADAFDALAAATGEQHDGWRLSSAALAAKGAAPVGEFLLIPFGAVKVERPLSGSDFEFNRQHALSAVRWFQSLGRKLAIDYEHQTFGQHNTRPDGLRPAAGWIGGLAVRDDGLWAVDVTWTDRARQLLAAGEYRYFSPVIFWTDEDCSDIAGLGPVALTNDPAMRGVAPLAASRTGEAGPEDEEVEEDVPATDAAEQELIPRAELEAAEAEVALLRRQLQTQEADSFIERGMRQGKILDSTSMDWREDFLRDAAEAEARLGRAPALRPPGRLVSAQAAASAATPELYRAWGVEAEDLRAFERAVTAGRVRVGAR